MQSVVDGMKVEYIYHIEGGGGVHIMKEGAEKEEKEERK